MRSKVRKPFTTMRMASRTKAGRSCGRTTYQNRGGEVKRVRERPGQVGAFDVGREVVEARGGPCGQDVRARDFVDGHEEELVKRVQREGRKICGAGKDEARRYPPPQRAAGA